MTAEEKKSKRTFFTFDWNQYDPETNEHLIDKYVMICGGLDEDDEKDHIDRARMLMIGLYGQKWSQQYSEEEFLKTFTGDQYNMKEHARYCLTEMRIRAMAISVATNIAVEATASV